MMEGEDNMLAKTPDTDIELMMLATNLIEVDGSGDLPPVRFWSRSPRSPSGRVRSCATRAVNTTRPAN
jgi:hypothetical protein